MSLDIEPRHRHHGGGLPRWLEWVTAISALVVSVASIFIAIHNGEIENKMLKANSFPYLIGGTSDATLEGQERISIDLLNNGVGPADERSLRMRLGDHYVTSVKDLIHTVVGPAEGDKAFSLLKAYKNGAYTRFIAPHDRGFVFRIDKTPENARYWDMLDRATSSPNWQVEYCYCSVFEECWEVKKEVHTAVKACKRDEPHEFMP